MPRVDERRAVAILLILLASGCGRGEKRGAFVADHPSARATLAADSVGLGDPVRLTVEAVVPKGSSVAIETTGDSIGGWKILRAETPVQKQEGGFDSWRRDLTIASYRLGSVGPDTLRLRAVSPRGDSIWLAYAPPPLHVGGMLKPGEPSDASKARDIRDVISTGRPVWPWFVAGALLAAAAAWYLAHRLRARRRAVAEEAVPPGPSPEEEFEAAIAALLAEGLLERGLYREFYYGVSRAVRLYLERKSGLPLLESTSAEVLSLLEPRIAGEFERVALRDWLSEGDLVKYARMERLQGEANRYLLRSRDLVTRLSKVWEPVAPVPSGPESSPTAPAEARPTAEGAA